LCCCVPDAACFHAARMEIFFDNRKAIWEAHCCVRLLIVLEGDYDAECA
jgi:hypothetical protein